MTLNIKLIRDYLNKEEKSCEWLAVQLECSMSTVRNLMNGKVPASDTLIRLAKLMRCSVEELILTTTRSSPKSETA